MPRLSKQAKPLEGTAEKISRNPKCARCRNHGFVVLLKGHTGKCQFILCKCWKCSLISERTKIMAFQRRIKKTGELHIKESQLMSKESVSEVKADPMSAPCQNMLLHDVSAAREAAGSNPESALNMPSRRTEVNGKTYAELEVQTKPRVECALSVASSLDMGAQLRAFAGGDTRGTEQIVEDLRFCVPPWPPHPNTDSALLHRTPRFPADYIFAEKACDLMPVPFPIKLYSYYPNSYAYRAFLVNMPAAGPDAEFGFPRFQNTSIPYSPEASASNEYRVPVFPPPSRPPPSIQEEMSLRYLPGSPVLLTEKDKTSNMHVYGNQLSEVSAVENVLPPQDM